MYENGKIRYVETFRNWRERECRRMMEEVNSTLEFCENFCKCHNVPPSQQ
jgi:hypothetical protein